jgi:2,3,4,5-tetrahydropyridine-2-carboxylate N-succinyltransferase
MMPPLYINVGAYVDDGSMSDSHALVGTCAQVGKGVHLSAGAMLGGVIEPIGANPVIIEDDVFIGGNCGLYEGVIVQEKAIIAAGVIITSGTRVYDAVYDRYLQKSADQPLIIPSRAVVVPGSRPLKQNPEFSVACPIIIKYRDEKTNAAVTLEDALR